LKRNVVVVVGILALGFLLLAAEGCSLFFDGDGLSSNRPSDSGSNDGQPGSGSDSNNNGTPDDGGGLPPSDASSSDAGCTATFCETFDNGPLGAGWTVDVKTGATLELSTTARSAPYALRARQTSVTSNPSALMKRDVAASGSRIACDFSLFIAALPSSQFIDMFSIQTTTAAHEYHLWFGVNQNQATFREDFFLADGGCNCPLQAFGPALPPAVNKWSRIRIETDFKTASLSYDGSIITAAPFGNFTPTGPLSIQLGIRGYPQDSADVLIDDVSCNVVP